MRNETPGFVVLYRWRLHPGAEASFIEGWTRITRLLRSRGGSLGSRLHRGPDGIWYGYAQWPDAAARERAGPLPQEDPDASRAMAEAVAERFPELILDPVADFLILPKD
jgi:hypothetical protein